MVTAAASRCPKLVVPTHFHPAVRSMGWTAAAERSRHVRLTVANGVGEKRHEAFRRPWRRCGPPVSPWSARGHGTTAAGSLRRGLLQVTRYRDWWGAMDGVFVDRVTTEANEVSHYAALSLRLVNSKRGPRRSTPRESCEDMRSYAGLRALEGPGMPTSTPTEPRWVPERLAHQFFAPGVRSAQARIGDALDLASRHNGARA